MSSTCLKVISMWRWFSFWSQMQHSVMQQLGNSGKRCTRLDYIYVYIYNFSMYFELLARHKTCLLPFLGCSCPVAALALNGHALFSLLIWDYQVLASSCGWKTAATSHRAEWQMKYKIPQGSKFPILYSDKPGLKALLLMVEGNLHPVGMPPSRSPPDGQNTLTEGQKLGSNIFNI